MTCEKKDRCEHGSYCQKHIGIAMNNCCFFEQKEPLTNEEWFCSLSTEEKAKVFANATYSTALAPMEILALGKEFEQKKWEMWLKQPHQMITK